VPRRKYCEGACREESVVRENFGKGEFVVMVFVFHCSIAVNMTYDDCVRLHK
jgi:hypothetical protein